LEHLPGTINEPIEFKIPPPHQVTDVLKIQFIYVLPSLIRNVTPGKSLIINKSRPTFIPDSRDHK
jgi:hypothetical protein